MSLKRKLIFYFDSISEHLIILSFCVFRKKIIVFLIEYNYVRLTSWLIDFCLCQFRLVKLVTSAGKLINSYLHSSMKVEQTIEQLLGLRKWVDIVLLLNIEKKMGEVILKEKNMNSF